MTKPINPLINPLDSNAATPRYLPIVVKPAQKYQMSDAERRLQPALKEIRKQHLESHNSCMPDCVVM